MRTVLQSTETAIIAILRADPTASREIIEATRNALAGKTEAAPSIMELEPIVRRKDVMRLTGLSAASIDRYSRLGYLERVTFGKSNRAHGFTAESVRRFVAGDRSRPTAAATCEPNTATA